MQVINFSPSASQSMCYLTGNPTTATISPIYVEQLEPRTLPDNDVAEVVSFTVPLEFESARPIRLFCAGLFGQVGMNNISVTALQVENLTRQQ